jgi:hypothetical protein
MINQFSPVESLKSFESLGHPAVNPFLEVAAHTFRNSIVFVRRRLVEHP